MNKDKLIEGLNADLAAELGTVIRYTYQAAKCYGLLGAELRELLAREAQDELGHAAFLMDVIQDLGGEPTTAPKPFPKPKTRRSRTGLRRYRFTAEPRKDFSA